MKVTKEEIYGYTGSSVFFLLIFLLLYFTVIKTTIKSGETGVLVNFGTVNLSTGTFEPRRGTPQSTTDRPAPIQEIVPTPETTPVQPNVPTTETRPVVENNTRNTTPPVITQEIESTAAIETARKEQEEKNRIEAEQRAQKAKEEEEQRRRDAINQQVSGAFGSGTTDGAYGTSDTGQNQSGTGITGTGIQGDPNSTTSAGSPTGTGYGEFNLGGRTLGREGLPRPDYNVQEEGRIVINITVNPQGNVILAEIGRGTNIDNTNLRNSSLEAARKAKFNSISGTNNQSGTITYRYSLK